MKVDVDLLMRWNHYKSYVSPSLKLLSCFFLKLIEFLSSLQDALLTVWYQSLYVSTDWDFIIKAGIHGGQVSDRSI